ncbi:hypothetical protein ACN4EG_21865 [Alkalinema pantanalense CENA528]
MDSTSETSDGTKIFAAKVGSAGWWAIGWRGLGLRGPIGIRW